MTEQLSFIRRVWAAVRTLETVPKHYAKAMKLETQTLLAELGTEGIRMLREAFTLFEQGEQGRAEVWLNDVADIIDKIAWVISDYKVISIDASLANCQNVIRLCNERQIFFRYALQAHGPAGPFTFLAYTGTLGETHVDIYELLEC